MAAITQNYGAKMMINESMDPVLQMGQLRYIFGGKGIIFSLACPCRPSPH